jgi:hypothetical protein
MDIRNGGRAERTVSCGNGFKAQSSNLDLENEDKDWNF